MIKDFLTEAASLAFDAAIAAGTVILVFALVLKFLAV